MSKSLRYLLVISVLVFCALPFLAHAAGAPVDTDVEQLYNYVRNWYENLLLPIGSVLAGLVIIYGGILYSVSGGEPSKIQKGKEYIIGAISGEVLLLCVYLIIRQVIA